MNLINLCDPDTERGIEELEEEVEKCEDQVYILFRDINRMLEDEDFSVEDLFKNNGKG